MPKQLLVAVCDAILHTNKNTNVFSQTLVHVPRSVSFLGLFCFYRLARFQGFPISHAKTSCVASCCTSEPCCYRSDPHAGSNRYNRIECMSIEPEGRIGYSTVNAVVAHPQAMGAEWHRMLSLENPVRTVPAALLAMPCWSCPTQHC